MEFELIQRYFQKPFSTLANANGESVLAGIGDDCAVLRLGHEQKLFVSSDTLVEGVHFFGHDTPKSIGWKALACNLSDLAACGAKPLGFTLNLSLPKVESTWLEEFSQGLLELALQENCPLIGGDTTSSGINQAASISIAVLGQGPLGHTGFHRGLAKVGDDVWVSGLPGLARLGLLLEYFSTSPLQDKLSQCCPPPEHISVATLLQALPCVLKTRATRALKQPMPRIGLSGKLRGLANACIDLSDGLSGDAGHIATASQVSITFFAHEIRQMWLQSWPGLEDMPQSDTLLESLLSNTLQGGDDFELCWTACVSQREILQAIDPTIWRIGRVGLGEGVWLNQNDASRKRLFNSSYTHFSDQGT